MILWSWPVVAVKTDAVLAGQEVVALHGRPVAVPQRDGASVVPERVPPKHVVGRLVGDHLGITRALLEEVELDGRLRGRER